MVESSDKSDDKIMIYVLTIIVLLVIVFLMCIAKVKLYVLGIVCLLLVIAYIGGSLFPYETFEKKNKETMLTSSFKEKTILGKIWYIMYMIPWWILQIIWAFFSDFSKYKIR